MYLNVPDIFIIYIDSSKLNFVVISIPSNSYMASKYSEKHGENKTFYQQKSWKNMEYFEGFPQNSFNEEKSFYSHHIKTKS